MYAVLGNPISHSLSPLIFKLFAAQLGQTIDYQAMQVSPEELSEKLLRLRAQGYKGVNLTTPLKEPALTLVQTLSESARIAGAMNVLTIDAAGCYHGHNTDGIGFVRDLRQKNISLAGKSILLLGAGGGARGLLPVLLQEKPTEVVIYNRSEDKARQLIENFPSSTTAVSYSPWEALSGHRFDMIINCTTLGLKGECLPFPGKILKPNACCYDLSYGKAAFPFLKWSKAQGAAVCHDGLGMLVEQAAEAFFLWRRQKVNTTPILHSLFFHSDQ